jgi:hypothetical protein
MNRDDRSDDQITQENLALKQELRLSPRRAPRRDRRWARLVHRRVQRLVRGLLPVAVLRLRKGVVSGVRFRRARALPSTPSP